MRTVIIPAAGKATRFGGTLKELLPINETDTPLLRAVQNAVIGMDADEIVLVTNPEKVSAHTGYLNKAAPYTVPISYRMQQGNELWGAIMTGLNEHMDGGMVMADTVTFVDSCKIPYAPIVFGTFKTLTPERFSVIYGNTILTKQSLLNTGESLAWGVVLWNIDVTRYWLSSEAPEYEHYDDAFRDVMQRFGFATFELPYYYDLGTFKSYVDYLGEKHG